MIIRKFKEGDENDCSRIRSENYSQILSAVYSTEEIQDYIDLYTSKEILRHSRENNIYVAENEDGILGFVSLSIERQAEIKLFFVDIKKQNLGIGSRLYNYIESLLGEVYAPIKRIIVHSNIYVPTIKFYESLGFEKRGEIIHNDRGKTLKCVELIKEIKIKP